MFSTLKQLLTRDKILPGMKRYHVTSGALNAKVYAFNADEATKKAILTRNPKLLGIIIGCKEVNAPDESEGYTLTERVLNDLGMYVTKE